MILGPAFTIDGVTYTPADKLNYDAVGYAVTGTEGGEGVSLAHRTLPLPSYVEVTSLETGRTILVRAERRGPMSGKALVELSPGAAAQLGMNPSAQTSVRVRRVNPPEIERAALRQGGQAPKRMDTPKSLVAVLLRKLDRAAVAPPVPAPQQPDTSTILATTAPMAAPVHKPAEAAPASAEPPRDARVVQVGAYSVKANAEATAAKVGGKLEKSGKLWIVRMGPYVARGDVTAALAKARGAGYSDARIQRAD